MSDLPRLDLWNEPSPFQNSQAYEQKNHNWSVLRNYGDYIGSYIKGITDAWDARFTAQIEQIPQPNEVIDARVNAYGETFPTLHDHLVNIEETSVRAEEVAGDENHPDSDDDWMSIILKVTDLTTSSAQLSYEKIGTTTFDLPQAGYVECKTTDLFTETA